MAKGQTGIGSAAVAAINKAPLTAVILLLIGAGAKYADFTKMQKQVEQQQEVIAQLEKDVVRISERLEAWIDWAEFNDQ